jgi:hypothetical protein
MSMINLNTPAQPAVSPMVTGVLALLDRLATPIPAGLTPTQIAHHAAAMVKLANTPNATVIRDEVKNTVGQLLEDAKAERAAMLAALTTTN